MSAVESSFAEAVGHEAASALGVADCAELAKVAGLILRDEMIPRRRTWAWNLLPAVMGGPLPAESLALTVAEGLDVGPDEELIAAARALQSFGVALCRDEGIPLERCPCFVDPAAWELEDVVFLVLRLAVGDWTGLVIPFSPLASP